jgi:colanic acid biosynthesis protein WcaH
LGPVIVAERRFPPPWLSRADLRTIVRLAPLVSIDLMIRNAQNQVLLGLRNNEPAKGFFFVPGGMILKGERLREAFERILKDETNCVASFEDAQFLGVYEHFYESNRFGETGYGTHYVVLGCAVRLADVSGLIGDSQHRELRWWRDDELLASDQVHDNTKAYFR